MITSLAMRDIELESERFVVRTLNVIDVTQEYLSWFNDEVVKEYVSWQPTDDALNDLRQYVQSTKERRDCLLFGIFIESEGHIGNIKFDPVDFDAHSALLGVLIGVPHWRRKGVFREVFELTSNWLAANADIQRFRLGVKRSNSAAIKSYLRAGFQVETGRPNGDHFFMVAQSQFGSQKDSRDHS